MVVKEVEMEDKIVYLIRNRETNELNGAYSRSYSTQYEFPSLSSARNSNVHGTFQDTDLYKVQKYKVTYTLLNDDEVEF